MLRNMTIPKRVLLYLGLFVVIVVSSFFWGWPGQALRARRPRQEIAAVWRRLGDDARFAEVNIRVDTADQRTIYVTGSVPDQNSLEHLKTIMDQEISAQYSVIITPGVLDGSEELRPAVLRRDGP